MASLRTSSVPPGWEPVAAICGRLYGRREDIVAAIMERIHDEISEYDATTAVSTADLHASVSANLEMMLLGTAERRGPTPQELEIRRELGVLRARQSLPVTALLQAFVVGYRELWDSVVREASAEPASVRDLLLSAASTVWLWVHDVTDAVGSAYHEETRRAAALTGVLRQRLLDALRSPDPSAQRVREIAVALGIDPDGRIRLFAEHNSFIGLDRIERVNANLRAVHGRQVVAGHEDRILVLDQGGHLPDVLAALRDDQPGELHVGVGVERHGLTGAAHSLREAEQALELSLERHRPVDFADAWHAVILHSSRSSVADLLQPGLARIAGRADLVQTLRTFTENGFSLSSTARLLHVHSNTVAYRLGRWTELTGWDPRTRDGLLRTITALELLTSED